MRFWEKSLRSLPAGSLMAEPPVQSTAVEKPWREGGSSVGRKNSTRDAHTSRLQKGPRAAEPATDIPTPESRLANTPTRGPFPKTGPSRRHFPTSQPNVIVTSPGAPTLQRAGLSTPAQADLSVLTWQWGPEARPLQKASLHLNSVLLPLAIIWYKITANVMQLLFCYFRPNLLNNFQ